MLKTKISFLDVSQDSWTESLDESFRIEMYIL